MPTLYILAGANGSGKTTYYFTAVASGFIEINLPYINVDLIIRNELGDYNEVNHAIAESLAKERIAIHIRQRENFMIESNLAKESEYDWLEKMQKNGYELVLYFLGTSDIKINMDRVHRRVKEGGHNVPDNIIEHRFKNGIMYLRKKIFLFDQVHLIDNSSETGRRFAFVQNGNIIEEIAEDCPEWIKQVLSLLKLIQSKKRKL